MLTPCLHCGQRPRGPGASLYGFVPSTSGDLRWRTKLCVGCASDALELIQEELAEVPMDKTLPYPVVDRCSGCVLPVVGPYRPIVVTAYFPKKEAVQYMGALHEACEVPAVLGQALQGGLQAA